ncbi:polymorphic toxin-type HINT domain-containing protein [Streptomyces sp. NPDC048269]|uniref:polymorphic toxin-type HINT domain-containing protein n=1 Tax=Streptomyces sp. NPDC048269 TaxID=3155753 RepID=UPI00343F6E8B
MSTYAGELHNSVRTTAGDCAHKATGQLISQTRSSYDALNAFGAAPSKGLVYQVDTNDSAGSGWITTARSEYDALGRATKVLDAAGNPLTTAYSPATGPAFSVTSTNALGHTSTTRSDPGRGVPLEDTDANGRKVTTAYDGLGRVTAVWTPSQKPGTDKAAHTFSYQIVEHEPPVVTSATLEDDGTYTQTIAIYDGLLRPRQGQSEALGGGRLITDTLYNANGTVRQTNNNYLADGKPDTNIFVPETQTTVLNSTQTAYDSLNRPVRTTTFHGTDAKDSTTAQYGGDWTLSRTGMSADGQTALKGSSAVKTFTDALGRTSAIEHYTATDLTTSNRTTYEYDFRNKLSKVTDAANNSWAYTYDARGRMTGSDDPDMGKSTFTYDNLDQQVSSTNASGQVQYTKYDALGRKTELRDDNATTGPKVATWTYDTLLGAKGLPVASTRWVGNDAFTSEVTGYDTEYRPTGSKITIPSTTATTGLAGTYAYNTTYTPTGKVQSTTLPATAGGLAAEKLITRYNADGMPQTMSGHAWYTAETVYSPYGEVLRTASGSAPNRVWTTNTIDPNTGRIAETQSHRETAPNLLSKTSYTYDTVGNPTSITETRPDTRPGSTPQSPLLVDRQCFTYDAMGRLTKAWTGKTDACTQPTDLDPTQATPGPDGDGYWQEYQFDAIGNRTQLLDKDPTNGSIREKTTYTYGLDIGGGVKKPHALASASKTTTKPGSTVTSLNTYAYDATGNTKTRRIGGDTQDLTWDPRNKLTSATSPGIGAVAVTGLAGKCLDVETGANPDDAAVQLLSCNESKPQQWRITGNTVQALGKCLTAIGGEARLKPCDGTPQQKFTYRTTDKALYNQPDPANPATGKCVTVPNDNAAEGNDLDIYDCHGTPAQQWNFSNTTTYLYDSSGNRLIEETGSSRTLYLGEAEITVNKAGQAMDAVRYYSSPGAPTTVRRTNGKTTGHSLSVLLTDHHNTATTTVEQTTNQPTTRRKSDPYGNPRGTQPTNWPGSRTFLGTGNDDNTTSLTHIGAREYEPTTGRFISVDPVLDITDPLQMNGYTYSNGNPITLSDPTGLWREDGNGHWYQGTTPPSETAPSGGPPTNNTAPKGNGGNTNNKSKNKDCGWSVKCHYNKTVKSTKKFWDENKVAIVSFTVEFAAGAACAGTALVTGAATGGAGFAIGAACAGIAASAGAAAANWMDKDADHSTTGILKAEGNAFIWGAATAVATTAALSVIGRAASALLTKLKFKPSATSAPSCNSFVPGTDVLLADGTSKPIEDLVTGDEVLATDPETGESGTKTVTATIYTEGDKKYADVSVQTDDGVKTITTTDHHPFWSESDQTWKNAGDLKPGTTLRTDEGSPVPVIRIRVYQATHETYNLTVTDFHTYYVLAGAAPVLVHNCGGGTTVYRGVPEGHPGFDAAVDGSVVPRGGTASAEAHQLGNTESPYTSWSTSEATARRAATRGETGVGVVLDSRIPSGRPHVHVNDEPWADPDLRGEFEVLIEGPMQGNPYPVWRPR